MNKNIKHLLLVLFTIIVCSPIVSAQQTFDFDNPAGTYIITDYLGKRITLKLQSGGPNGILMTKGRGTITINGRTLTGTWSRFDDNPYIGFETYGNVRITYNLPSGPAKTDQIIIWNDGRASYNASELMKTDHDWIPVKRSGTNTRKKTRK